MTQTRLRNALSVFLLFAHLIVPALVFLVYTADGLTKEELTQLLEIIVPMVSALSGLGITHIIRMKRAVASQRKEPQLSRLFVCAALGFPALFVAMIAGLVLLKAWNIVFRSFDDLKIALAAVETLFGAYTGRLMASLFDKEKAQ